MTPALSIAAGWIGILMCFLTGMLMGLVTMNDAALGGYASKQRRYLRLGHIACAALGIVNILAGLCAVYGHVSPLTEECFLIGLITMPLVCWITMWVPKAFFLFPIPSISLFAGVALIVKDTLQ